MENKEMYITEKETVDVLQGKLCGYSDNGEPYYKIGTRKFVIVDSVLHTINDPDGWAEADYPVRKSQFKQFQNEQ